MVFVCACVYVLKLDFIGGVMKNLDELIFEIFIELHVNDSVRVIVRPILIVPSVTKIQNMPNRDML